MNSLLHLAFTVITTSFLPKSVNFLVGMKCKSYCNGTNFRGNKFSRIPMKLMKLNSRKVFFEIQLENIDTAKKLKKSMVWEIHQQKKNVISFLCREYLSLENIHQLSQLQLPRFISFFLWILEYIPNFSWFWLIISLFLLTHIFPMLHSYTPWKD